MLHLPAALSAMGNFSQFILYKLVPGKRPDKMDKIPVHPVTLRGTNAHDRGAWTDAATATQRAAQLGHPYGVAFVFTEADPFFFVDIDGCLTASNEWAPIVADVLAYFPGCAVELSQSGRGLHIFGTGTVPAHSCRRDDLGLEFYTEGRFVALTGNILQGDCAVPGQYVTEFVNQYFPPAVAPANGHTGDGPRPEWDGPTDDADLLDMAMRSKSAAAAFGSKASFAQLWEGDPAVLAKFYPSSSGDDFGRSQADMALASHLAFWTGCDVDRITRLMWQSGLARDKWETHATYLSELTIARAVAGCKDVYRRPQLIPTPDGGAVAPPVVELGLGQPVPVDGAPVLFGSSQVELFKGCVYVLDRNEIYTPEWGLLDQARFCAMFGGYMFALDNENRKFVDNAWQVFTKSQAVRFPRVVSTCFRPELEPGSIIQEHHGLTRVNVYKPLNTLRIPGDARPFLDFMARLLPDERDRVILLSYMAAIVQHPGVKFQWWPVLQGVQGNGKTLLLTAMRMAVGEPYCFAPNVSEIAKGGNKFNGWIENRLFVAMEEIYVPERRTFLEEFKTTITNDWLPIERKGVDQVMGDNRANGMMATNHRDGVPINQDDRRYAIFFTAQQCKADLQRDGMAGDYFTELYDWCKGEGRFAVMGRGYGWAVINNYLREYVIDPEFNPAGACKVAPRTSSTDAALKASLGSVEMALLDAIEAGAVGFAGGWVSSHFLDKFLRDTGLQSRAPASRRRDMLGALGYVPHPALKDGRATRFLIPDGTKSRLYVAKDAPAFHLATSEQAERAYMEAQAAFDLDRISAALAPK